MKTIFPRVLAILFALSWLVALWLLPVLLETFADFKIEAAPLTLAIIQIYRMGGFVLMGILVLTTATLLALRFRVGWQMALGLNLLLDLYLWGLLLPIIALINGLSGADEATGLILSSWPDPSDPMLFPKLWIGAAVLNQILKVVLVAGRRVFER